MSFFTRKRLVALSTVGVLLVAGAAIAYFTASGSGSGSATVGTSTALTLYGSTSGSLYPGASATVSFTADNPSGGKEQVGTIQLVSIKACTGSGSSWNGTACSNGGTRQTSCEDFSTGATNDTSKDYWMPDVAANQEVAAGNGKTITATGTLTMNDLSTSQDLCQGADLQLSFTS